MPESNPALTLALAMCFGILVQVISRHIKMPGIVLLLGVGILLGPDMLGLIHPASLGKAMHMIVGFSVAVILFEGGMNLRLNHIKREQHVIRQLITVGALVTAIGGVISSKLIIGWDWRNSILFGVLIIVTGPTVISPLLKRLRFRRSVSTVLEAEGVLLDAIGAVLEQYYQETGKNPVSPNMSLYLGSSYSDEEILLSAKRFNFKITKVSKIDTAIDLIGQGKVIGWFQGRSEFGPRGLGNRSILALPTEQKYKDIVNEKVKKREPWRPFCPTIIEEKSGKFLKNPSYAPYMILGFEMKNPELYPAVTHVDGTCRPQILKKDDNPDFYQVVKGLDGIVLNTSFNLAGDPIVETPYDALMTLKNSEMDALLMNDFLIEKCV